MADKIAGGCLCGRVRFETTSEPVIQVLCHCTDCQTVSGSGFYTAYVVPLDTVEVLQGELKGFTVQSDRGTDNTRKFCIECGTRVFAELESGMASVNGMALDNREHFSPSHNHRSETKPGWCALNDALQDLPGG